MIRRNRWHFNKKKRPQRLLVQLIGLAILAMALMGVLMTWSGNRFLRESGRQSSEEVLRTAAEQLDSQLLRTMPQGDWVIDDKGRLQKAGTAVDLAASGLWELKERTGLEYSLSFGRQRILTTMDVAGTADPVAGAIPQEVYAEVVTAGGSTFAEEQLYGDKAVWDSYFVPLVNSDGTVVGTVSASRLQSASGGNVLRGTLLMALIAVGFLALLAVLLILTSGRASAQIGGIAQLLGGLSEGSLRNRYDRHIADRNDEIGEIAARAGELDDKLTRVIHTTREVSQSLYTSGYDLADSAVFAADASEQIADRISEVVRVAASQAESIRSAAGNASGIGHEADAIAEELEGFAGYAEEMRVCLERCMETIRTLADHADEMATAALEADDTTRAVHEASARITEFSQAIAGIAAQTNLLALNASIEASRAGDSGRGFAVVAEEIRSLAEESRRSADEIRQLVEHLSGDSEASVRCLDRLNRHAAEQARHLSEARADMEFIADDVRMMRESVQRIGERLTDLSMEQDSLTDTMQDLSVISEQNASFTEETTASMQELHTTFTVISESAEQLQVLADDLRETMAFFRE